jgi:(p)ppGpp synthase/HD superfamily hydrolase
MAVRPAARATEKIKSSEIAGWTRLAPLVARARRFGDLEARLPKTRSALAYAEERHAGQRRLADGAPFIEHPLEVAELLYRAGAPDDVIAAGVLHDTIEKAGATVGELQDHFGPHTTELVVALSEDPEIPGYARRKAALRDQVAAAGPEALMVFAADKISKVRELRATGSHPTARLTHYRRCVELLERLLSDSPLVMQLRAEFDRVAAPLAA